MTQEELDTVSEEIAREEEREREADRRRILEIIASLANVSEQEQAVIQNRIERWARLGGGKRGPRRRVLGGLRNRRAVCG